MIKMLLILRQEYKSTVMTKAFIFGAFIFPIVFYTLLIMIPNLIKSEAPQLSGTIAIYDATGISEAAIKQEFDPAVIDSLQKALQELETDEEKKSEMLDAARAAGGETAALAVKFAARWSNPLLDQPIPELTFETIPLTSDAARLKELRQTMQQRIRSKDLVAFVEIGEDALEVLAEGQITLYVAPDLHPKNLKGIEYGVEQGLLNARLEMKGTSLIEARLNMVPIRLDTRTVTEEGDAESIGRYAIFIPFAFMMLLWISTFTGGQYLLMSTIEEKASRVMEVMLSAVSPLQMMTGKILGQGAVAMTMLAVYAFFGFSALNKFDLGYLLEPGRVVIFIPFFFMAFMFVACMMAAIGSAVTDMREANALMMPAMMVLIVPFMVLFPVIESPNSLLSTTMSFIPPISPFIMAIRLGGTQPIAIWQIIVSLIIGWTAVVGAVWVTAKIFRIGILMYGKPPNLRTMLRWIRQA